MTKLYAIILAGGKGVRMNNIIPKQFLPLHGRPVLMHTIEKFASIPNLGINIIVVLPKDQKEQWDNLCKKHDFNIPHSIVEGGSERFYSVKNALETIKDNALVAIHDGVRPLVSEDLIIRSYKAAQETGSSVPATTITESIRKRKTNRSLAVSRDKYFIVQTPQTFSSDLIKTAYQQRYTDDFTDDATVYESMGHIITLIKGEEQNIKITSKIDLIIAEALLK